MIVEVLGISPRNKGALLMLDAICEQIWSAFPNAKIAIPAPWPADLRLARGLWLSSPASGKNLLRLAPLVPGSIRKELGLVLSSEVDVVLDASGFGYGDFWGVRAFYRRLIPRLRRKVVVLLPQALGPFTAPGMDKAWSKVTDGAHLLFARDKQSLAYAQGNVDKAKLQLAPDFTNLLKPPLPENLKFLSGKALLIPNRKMINKDTSAETYFAFLKDAVVQLRASGREPWILIHEGKDDRQIADRLNEQLTDPVQIVEVESALDTKAAIAAAELIVSSRFHGIVSALSAGVPALATGWSHKYQELMGDYGCEEDLVALNDPEIWNRELGAFLKRASTAKHKKKIADAAAEQKTLSRAMWDQVISIIRQKVGPAA